jgi:hypothetical protein
MIDISKVAKIYENILEATKEYNKKEMDNWDINGIISKARLYLYGVKLINEYGFNINPSKITSFNWNSLNDCISIGSFGEKHRRTISWLDEGEQPVDEVLLKIGFPTGPYIFGGDYPEDLFKRFFAELKGYGPKYSDSTNRALYFTPETAKDVFNNFNDILEKYIEINKQEFKQRKIDKMKAELEKLEENSET